MASPLFSRDAKRSADALPCGSRLNMWGLAALAVAVIALGARADGDELADPLPLRRVLLSAAKLPAELQRAKDGVLIRLPRREFEQLARRAARARKGRDAPRLVEAQYRAALADGPALVGTAQWKVLHAGAGPALLRLTGEGGAFNLAVRQPRFDNREALLTTFPEADGKSGALALYVDRPGEHTVTMEWTARADPRPEGLLIDLRVPECPAGSLELELPDDRRPSLVNGALVSGPHPAQTDGRSLWRIATGGKSQLTLLLRRVGDGGPAPVVLAWHKMVQRLSPDGLESASAFSLEALHQDVRELTFDFDPILRPVEVQGPSIERWEVTAGKLRVRLARPLREGLVEVRCLAPLSASVPAERPPDRPLVLLWSSPALRLAGAVPRGETLELWLHPELRLVSWQPGDFRLTDSSLVTDPERGGTHRRLTLVGGGLTTGDGSPRRPGGQVQAGGVEFRARQHAWWRLAGDSAELISQIDYEVRQGQLFQLPLRLPDGWEVEAVETAPGEVLRSWGVRADKAGPLLLVDLRRPLRAGGADASATLNLRLRGGVAARRDVAFPDVVPIGTRYREGGLAIDFDEQAYRAVVRTSLTPGEPAAGGPWGRIVPDYYYPFRGEGIAGTLRLDPLPPRFRARASTDVSLAGGRAVAETRLLLAGESGALASVDVYLSQAETRPWDWHVEGGGQRLRRAEHLVAREAAAALAPLGARPLGAAVLAAARPVGSFWRLWLDRPLVGRQTMTLRATRALSPRAGLGWDVPLITALGATQYEGEVTLHLAGAELVSVARAGLTDAPPRRLHGQDRSPLRAYLYGDPWARLAVEARQYETDLQPNAAVDRARLTVLLTAEGELRQHFRFRLARWPQLALPVQMPEGAKLVATAVAGLWMEHPPTPDERGVVALPVPAGAGSVLYELLYTTARPRSASFRIRASAPQLPIAAGAFDRRWLFPPDVLPVGDAGLSLFPGSPGNAGPRFAGARFLEVLRLGPALAMRPAEDSAARRRAIIDACAGLCAEHGGKRLSLARVVEELVADLFGDSQPLLIDRPALLRAGLDPSTRLTVRAAFEEGEAATPWDDRGLVLVPARAGVLLTTREQVQRWPAEQPPVGVEDALVLAAARGQDPSSCFVTALEWLGADRLLRPPPGLFRTGDDFDGWTTWAPVAGGAGDSVLVVRRDVVAVAGLALAAVLPAALLLTRRRPVRLRSRGLLLWLGGAGLALAWLPSALADLAWWPLVAGLGIAGLWYLTWACRRVARAPVQAQAASAVGAGAVLLLVVAASFIRAEGDPEMVFLVPEGDDPAGAILVRPGLVKTLEAMARPALTPSRGAVLVSASYEGKVVNGRAEFAATFQAYSFVEGPATLELPLDEAQLVGDVFLDGARVLPVTLPTPRAGYALRVNGAGRHKVELRFQAAVQQGGDDVATRQVRIGVPPLVQSRIVFQAPEGARHLRVASRHGGQRLAGEDGPPRIEADIGAIATPLSVRWYQEQRPAKPPRVEFREAYLWDLRVDASLLTALVRYAVRDGAVTTLAFDLPPGLEVRAAQARRPSPEKGGEVRPPGDTVRLSGWAVQGEGVTRTLRLEFPVPVSGAVEVTVELVPTGAWPPSLLVPLPRPLGEPDPLTPGYLAFRQQGLDVTRTNWLRLTGLRAEAFAPFWPAGSRPAAATLDYASSFRRDPKQPPELRLAMRPVQPHLHAMQELRYQVGPTRAELTARLDLVATGKDLSLVEYEIDSTRPVTIASVTGPEVSRWSQSGSRLLIWLEKTTGSARVELSGWVPLAPAATKGKKEGPARLELPCLRLSQPAAGQTRLVLRPTAGLTLTPQGLKQLTPERPTDGGDLAYLARKIAYGGNFIIRPGPSSTVDVVTTVRLEGNEAVFLATVDYRLPGEMRAVNVRLRGWEGDAWLEAPAGTVTRRREQHRRSLQRRERSWSLGLAQGVAGHYRLTLRGRLTLDDPAARVALPEVLVPGARLRQTVRLEGGLAVDSATGLDAVGAAEWRVAAEGWGMRVVPRREAPSAPVQILLTELHSTLPDGARWLHEARFWLRHRGPTEVKIVWPEHSEVIGVQVDGDRATTGEGGQTRLSLSDSSGIREVVFRYRRAAGSEPLDRPDPTPPQLEEARPGPLVLTLDVPSGWEVAAASAGQALGAGATRRAVVELHRAALALALVREAVEQQRPQDLALARRRFARAWGLADLALKAGADPNLAAGPNGLELSQWLAQLRKEQRTLVGQPEAIASLAEPILRADAPPAEGTPFGWQQQRAGETLSVRLAPGSQRLTRLALTFSGQWLLLLLIVWTITLSGALRTLARWLWPEQATLAAALGWQAVGPTALVLALLALGLVGRLAIVLRAARERFGEKPVQASTHGSSRR